MQASFSQIVLVFFIGVRVSSKQSIFFSVQTETNRNSTCFGCFSVFFAKPPKNVSDLFRFVSVFQTGIKTTKTNRTLSKQTETNRKNLQKTFSIRGSSKKLIFFSRFKLTKTQSVLVVFLFFCETQKFFSAYFGVPDRYRNNRNKQN